MQITQKEVNQLAYDIVDCAIEVHKYLGPGLLESVYEKCMIEELNVLSQVPVPILLQRETSQARFKAGFTCE